MNLSKNSLELIAGSDAIMASAAAAASPYAALAAKLATALAGVKKHAETVKGEKESVWDSFKSACAIGVKSEHSVKTLRAGLQIACENAGIPSGSFRGYVATVENLYSDVLSEKLTLAQVKEISVKDARERYQDAAKKARLEAVKRLTDAIGEWSPEAIITLAVTAEKVNAKAAKSKPAQKSGEKVGPDKKAANG